MKSFVAYTHDIEKILFPTETGTRITGKLMVHCELFKKVSDLAGSIVKCGIDATEEFERFGAFKNIVNPKSDQHFIAFEKVSKKIYVRAGQNGDTSFHFTHETNLDTAQLHLKGASEKIQFVPGNICYSIADYLIENPELKIAYLNVDLDDYESTLTALQFFYPRVVEGGIIIFDNYYKEDEDYKAISDYFSNQTINLQNFSINKGPHYLVKC